MACFVLLTSDREFADHNKALLNQWLQVWTPRAIAAARDLQPLWSQPTPGRRGSRTAWTGSRAVQRLLADLGLDTRRSCPVTTFKTAESPFKSDNTASNQCGVTLMNNQVGAVMAQVMETKPNVRCRHLRR